MSMSPDGAQIASALIRDGHARVPPTAALDRSLRPVLAEARRFFGSPLQEKARAASAEILEGFRPQGREYSQDPSRPDLNESFSVWPRNSANSAVPSAGREPLHVAMRNLIDVYVPIVTQTLVYLRRHFVSDDAASFDFLDASYLQVNAYRPREAAREFLQDLHEDGHLITIIGADAPGLEVQVDGRMIESDLHEGGVLVLPGSILTAITGGAIPPMSHRVRKHDVEHRLSVMFFVNPSMAAPVWPWVIPAGTPRRDLRALVDENSARFGLPRLTEVGVRGPS